MFAFEAGEAKNSRKPTEYREQGEMQLMTGVTNRDLRVQKTNRGEQAWVTQQFSPADGSGGASQSAKGNLGTEGARDIPLN